MGGARKFCLGVQNLGDLGCGGTLHHADKVIGFTRLAIATSATSRRPGGGVRASGHPVPSAADPSPVRSIALFIYLFI